MGEQKGGRAGEPVHVRLPLPASLPLPTGDGEMLKEGGASVEGVGSLNARGEGGAPGGFVWGSGAALGVRKGKERREGVRGAQAGARRSSAG